jgi:hypothetical protein
VIVFPLITIFSPVPGCLPHTFGQERMGYTCGSLFVDHASGKSFNFAQYSNNANKTIQSAQQLESMARDEGFRIKSYYLDNGFFLLKTSRTIVFDSTNNFLSVRWVPSIKMGFLNATSKRLPNGRASTCSI